MPRAYAALVALVLAAVAALAAAGCGGDDASGPLDEALGYLPEDAPFAVAIDTDLEGQQFRAAAAILDKFPFGESVERELREGLEQGDADFRRDIRPLLGNPFVVGAPDARSFTSGGGGEDQFVAAIQVEDEGRLEDTVRREGAEERAEASGATIYEDDDGDFFAIEEDVLVVSDSRRTLEQALEQRDQDDRLDEDRFEEALADLPESALLRVYADVGALIAADPETRTARRIEWVRALDTLGATASVQEDRLGIDFDLTTRGNLSEEDLPIAAGDQAPDVVQREGEIAFGLRDASQIIEFAQAAGQAADPGGFGEFEAAKRQVERRADVDVDRELVGQLTGSLSVSAGVDGSFGVRGQLRDARTFATALQRLARAAPRLGGGLGGRLTPPGGGRDLYTFRSPDGDTVAFGVVNEVLVLSDDPARARRLASESPETVEGAEGSVALTANAETVANQVVRRLGGLAGTGGQLFTGPLGDLTGSIGADTGGMRGRFELEID